MKFEKLKRFYEVVDEFGFEVILEIQNLAVPCKFKPNKNIGDLLERLEKGTLEYDLMIFESGQIEVGKYILMDAEGIIYVSSGIVGAKRTVIAKDLDDFFSKFKLSFQYLPSLNEVLRKKRYITLYLDEKYEAYDLARLIQQAASEATSRIKVEHLTESRDNQLENYLVITHKDITERIDVRFNSSSFIDYLDKELNPFINEKIKLDYKFTVVHENVWDNRAKVVFVNAAEYKSLEASNLIMDSVDLLIN